MSLAPEQQALRLRAELTRRRHHAADALDLAQLTRVAKHVGDTGVAADAIAMWPRPAWLRKLIGDKGIPTAA